MANAENMKPFVKGDPRINRKGRPKSFDALRELARGGGFPDEYKFIDRKSAINRIGNSVPPLFMRSIANHIRCKILSSSEDLPGGRQ